MPHVVVPDGILGSEVTAEVSGCASTAAKGGDPSWVQDKGLLSSTSQKNKQSGCESVILSEGGGSNLSKAFISGGNPNHHQPKHLWKLEHEESRKMKNRKKSLDAAGNSIRGWTSASLPVSKLEDYFSKEDIQNVRLTWGEKQMGKISPSVAAVTLNRFDVLKKILKEDADSLMYSEGQYMTPLGCAILTMNWDMIEFILDKDQEKAVNCKDALGNTALVKAALIITHTWLECMFCDLLSKMENYDVDLLSPNVAGVTLVHALSYQGWVIALEAVIKLVESRPTNSIRSVVNATMKDGTTPLMLAVDSRSEGVCAVLLFKGADPLAEDKAGYTALCRSLNGEAPLISRNTIPRIFKLLISNLDELERDKWDFEIYFSKTLQSITNHPSDAVFAVERFYRLGRFVLLFVLRCVVTGSGLLLRSKFFSKLCHAGHKHLHQTDYVYTICLTWFEILVYSEDLSCWNKYIDAFLKEGAADFCLKVLQRFTSVVDTDTAMDLKSKCQSNSSEFDGSDNVERLAFIESPVPGDRNVALAALMPFIQLIDASGMHRWFAKNFTAISSCYKNIKPTGSNTALSGDHIKRTNQKAAIFQAIMHQDTWTTMYQDTTDSESWLPRDYKNKKYKKTVVPSSDAKVVCFPYGILHPPSHLLRNNEDSDEGKGGRKRKTLLRPVMRKGHSVDSADVHQQLNPSSCTSEMVVNKITVDTNASPTGASTVLQESLSNSSIALIDPKLTTKFVKNKVALGPYANLEKNCSSAPLDASRSERSVARNSVSSVVKKLERRGRPFYAKIKKELKTRSTIERIQKGSKPRPFKEWKNLKNGEASNQRTSKLDGHWKEIKTTYKFDTGKSIPNLGYARNVIPKINPFSSIRNAISKERTPPKPVNLSPSYMVSRSLKELHSDLYNVECGIYHNLCVHDFLLVEGLSTCLNPYIWMSCRDEWRIHLALFVTPDGLFLPPDEFIEEFYDAATQLLLFNEGDRSEHVTFTHGPDLESNFDREDARYLTRQQTLYRALSIEYIYTLMKFSAAFNTLVMTTSKVLLDVEKGPEFGLHLWKPLLFSRKYIYKPMSTQEMFEDFVKTYPSVSPLLRDPIWTGKSLEMSPCDPNNNSNISLMFMVPNRTTTWDTLQRELDCERVYMAGLELWEGIYRQFPDVPVIDCREDLPDYQADDGLGQTTYIRLQFQSMTTSQCCCSCKTNLPMNTNKGSISISYPSSTNATPIPTNDVKTPSNSKTSESNKKQKIKEYVKKFEPKTKKFSAYTTSDKFEALNAPSGVPQGVYTLPLAVNYETENIIETIQVPTFSRGPKESTLDNLINQLSSVTSTSMSLDPTTGITGVIEQLKGRIRQGDESCKDSMLDSLSLNKQMKSSVTDVIRNLERLTTNEQTDKKRTVAVQTSRRMLKSRRIDN